jgi:hypothetical protein
MNYQNLLFKEWREYLLEVRVMASLAQLKDNLLYVCVIGLKGYDSRRIGLAFTREHLIRHG